MPKRTYQPMSDDRYVKIPGYTAHRLLSRCPRCSAPDVFSNARVSWLCEDCGKDWQAYRKQVSRAIDNRNLDAVCQAIEATQAWRQVNPEYALLDNYLDKLLDLRSHLTADRLLDEGAVIRSKLRTSSSLVTSCVYCGKTVEIHTAPDISRVCPDCAAMYNRFRYLKRKLPSATGDECKELLSIIEVYRDNHINRRKAPDIRGLCRKVGNRLEALQAMSSAGE